MQARSLVLVTQRKESADRRPHLSAGPLGSLARWCGGHSQEITLSTYTVGPGEVIC